MNDADIVVAYIALGSNLGDRWATFDRAVTALALIAEPGFEPIESDRYESAAMSVPERPDDTQPDYLNSVSRFGTRLSPHALLDALQSIENEAGRDRRAGRWAARTLDLDLLLYADLRLDDDRLTLPHPGIGERAFVLRPLAQLDETLEIPGSGTVLALLERIDPSGATTRCRRQRRE